MRALAAGISADKIEKLQLFSVKECSNKFPVAVGTSAIIKSYDAKLPLLATLRLLPPLLTTASVLVTLRI